MAGCLNEINGSLENSKGIQDTWKGELGGLRQIGGTESGKKDIKIFRLQIYMKYRCLNTKLEKLS